MMGASPREAEIMFGDKAKPAHEVTLSSFLIGEMEVTHELWEAVTGNDLSAGEPLIAQYPVHEVTVEEVLADFLPKSRELTEPELPADAEVYIVRGGDWTALAEESLICHRIGPRRLDGKCGIRLALKD